MCTYLMFYRSISGVEASFYLACSQIKNERPPEISVGSATGGGAHRGNHRPPYAGISLNHPKTRCRYPVEEIRLRGLFIRPSVSVPHPRPSSAFGPLTHSYCLLTGGRIGRCCPTAVILLSVAARRLSEYKAVIHSTPPIGGDVPELLT